MQKLSNPSLTLGALRLCLETSASNDGLKARCHPSSTLRLHRQRAQYHVAFLHAQTINLQTTEPHDYRLAEMGRNFYVCLESGWNLIHFAKYVSDNGEKGKFMGLWSRYRLLKAAASVPFLNFFKNAGKGRLRKQTQGYEISARPMLARPLFI